MAPMTFAHRGARALEPENTVAAFRRALEAGVSGIESDAWLSADGEVVLVHDPVVRRGLRRRKVASSSAAELAELGVPRLGEVYAELGDAFELSIDLQHERVAGPLLDVAADAGRGALERLWCCTPDEDLVARLLADGRARVVHSCRKERIARPLERHAAQLATWGVDALNLHHTEWTAGLVSLFHRFGVRCFAWDVQEVRHVRAVLRMGVDAIYGDHPDRLVGTVAEWITDGGRPVA